MIHVITEPCIGTCDTACVTACPVDCIHGPLTVEELEYMPKAKRREAVVRLQMYIDPDTCIGCGACVDECPVQAIYDEDDVPPEWAHYTELNAEFFRKRGR